MLSLCDDAVGFRLTCQAILFRLPCTICSRFMVVDGRRPIPLHISLLKDIAQLEPHGAFRTVWLPKEGPLHVSVLPPAPAILRPIALRSVPSCIHEVPEVSVGDQEAAGLEVRHLYTSMAILVVPTIRWEVPGLAQVHSTSLHCNHAVAGEVYASRRSHWRSFSLRCWVQSWPCFGHLHEVQRRLAEQHGRCLDVDSLVLEPHEQRPHGVVPSDRHRRLSVVVLERRVRCDDVGHRLVHGLAVGMNL
mmetsp:Transcript_33370/g.76167  ORF Transcript_33370/g.76167 Transcript_33370/m.76167 type:complete len:247 (-) Transcript_33370:810-1550(-)